MDPNTKRIQLALFTLRAIEEAVTADSVAEARAANRSTDAGYFIDSVRARIDNAVDLFCADAVASSQR